MSRKKNLADMENHHKITILIIEDDEAIRASLADILEAAGNEVIIAENGVVGIQKARQYLPDLIISDLMMPEMNGHDVLTELNLEESTASIPFIFLSAKDSKSTISRTMDMGADAYLIKPVSSSDLLETIAARLAKRGLS